MGPSWDDGTVTYQGTAWDTSVTFYPTCEAELKEDAEQAAREIEYLENMMYERADHKDNNHALQCREVKHVRRAQVKYKRPHMNRRIIR